MPRHRNPSDTSEPETPPDAPEATSHPEAPGTVTREIDAVALPKLQERVDALVKRAKKLGLPPLVLSVGPKVMRTRKVTVRDEWDGSDVVPRTRTVIQPYEAVEVTITGESPKLPGGWRFLATIDHEGPLNVVRAVPGESVPMAFRTRPPACEHCRLRRDRRETFVVENDAGAQTQVGRSCLVDFMGHKSAAQIADLATLYADLFADFNDPDEFEGGGGGRQFVLAATFLAHVARVIEEYGWVSKAASTEGKPSTVFLAEQSMDPPRGSRFVPPSFENIAKAEATIAWAATIPADTQNDYLWNVKAILAKEFFTWRDLGIAASAVAAYDREQGYRREREQGPRRASEHFGVVGERSRVKVRVERVIVLESEEYGISYLHLMKTVPEGNVARWKTATEKLHEGKEYDFVCTVAEHGEYKGTKQTMLKRCAVYVSDEEKKAAKELAAMESALHLLTSHVGHPAGSILNERVEERPSEKKDLLARRKLLADGFLHVVSEDKPTWQGPGKHDILRLTPQGLERALWLGLEIISRSTDDRWMNEPDVGVPHVHGDKATPLIARGLVGREDKRLFLSDVGLAELERLRGAFAGSGKTKRKKNPTDDDERETTDARTAATVMLREYGFGGSSGDEEDARRPRRVTPQNVKDYCSYQARVVSEDDAKLAAAMVNRRLADWHAEHPGEAEEDERVREGYERELHEGTPRKRAARRGNPADTVHRGYMLRTSPFTGKIAISKDGSHVAWAENLTDAKRIVDSLAA